MVVKNQKIIQTKEILKKNFSQNKKWENKKKIKSPQIREITQNTIKMNLNLLKQYNLYLLNKFL